MKMNFILLLVIILIVTIKDNLKYVTLFSLQKKDTTIILKMTLIKMKQFTKETLSMSLDAEIQNNM